MKKNKEEEPREIKVARLQVIVKELRNNFTHHAAQRELHNKAADVALRALQDALAQCYALNMTTQEIWQERPWKDEDTDNDTFL